MSRWLRQCSAWQFVLCCGGTVFLASLAAGAAAQWMWRGHLDFSSLLGTAIGCTLGASIIALWHRVHQSQTR
jgi:NhaP-type Na+/H+ and K+/H+ antiporter